MKKVILFLAMTLHMATYGQHDSISNSFTADFDLFIRYLEETHPDPYTAFGGRMSFKHCAQNMRKQITNQRLSARLWEETEVGHATVVGVPSAQAGNAFMEVTDFYLPYTGIGGSISNAVQVMFPDNPEKGKTFMPDFPMKWQDYRKYDFDPDAEILYCIDLIKRREIGKPGR